MELIIPLAKAAEYPIDVVGGKAHNLGKLMRAGFPVPDGVVVSAETEPDAVLTLLHDGLWAVRSSAVAEDSGGQSFAGQHGTFLNVPAADVPEKITACRASIENRAARAYRLGHQPSAMPVIVQEMVIAQASGVAFTVDPVSGKSEHLLVEMKAGSGEDLVGGGVAPISLRIPREAVSFEFAGELPIPKEHILTLARVLQVVEDTLGKAQDVEWCYADQQFWLLQARPISTIRAHWTRANIGEVMPGVVTPLTWSVFRRHLTGMEEDDGALIRLIDGRAHLRREAVLGSFEWLAWADQDAVCRALGLEPDHDRLPPQRSLLSWGASLLFLADALGLINRLSRRVRKFTRAQDPSRKDIPQLGLSGLLERLSVWDEWTRESFQIHLYATTYAIGAFGVLMHLKSEMEVTDTEEALLDTWQASQSADIGRVLHGLAIQARKENLRDRILDMENAAALSARLAPVAGGPEWLAAWHSFFERYGDRTSEEFELSSPRWKETPDLVLGLLQRELRLEPERTGAKASATSASRQDWMFERISQGYSRFVRLREEMKHEVIRGYGALRQIYLSIGQQLAEIQRLEEAEDVFFLDDSEVRQLADRPVPELLASVQLRRRQHRRYQEKGREITPSDLQTAEILKGIGCSPGFVEGRARVVKTLQEGLTLKADEILVVPHADPAWTPLILSSAGVVADIGGYLSHTATVAREFGIPAVFNVPSASAVVEDGSLLRVDGKAGIVTILAGQP